MSSPTQPAAAEVEAAFLSHIQARGIPYPGPVFADGEKHRVALEDDKPGEKSGEYALHLDGRPAGMARDYRQHGPGEDILWKWDGNLPAQTPTDRRAQAEAADRRKAEREAQEARNKAEAAAKAQGEWDQGGEPAPDHGYLRAKGIKAHGIRQAGPVLLVRVMDSAGKLHGLQRIHENSDKRFGKDEAKTGHFAPAGGDWRTAPRIFLGEGYATAATLYEAHEPDTTAALAAFDKGNLAAVARVIREARPDADIIIAGDNDQWKTLGQNPGLKSARAAAEAIGAPVVIPTFAPRNHPPPGIKTGPTDWNDLALLEGPEEVRRQIAEQLAEQLAAAPAPQKEGPMDQTSTVPINPPEPGESNTPVDEDSQPDVSDDEATVRHLATLKPFAYARQRAVYAAALKVNVSVLDDAVRAERSNRNGSKLQGDEIKFIELEPWPNPVNIQHTLDDIAAVLRRHIVIGWHDTVIATLWAAHTHCFKHFIYTPRLLIDAPAEECAKSLLSEMVQPLVPRPLPTENLSEAVFFRATQQYQPTWFLDEADKYAKEEMKTINDINAGWQPGGRAMRCVGDDHEVRGFTTYTPIAMAGIGISKILPRTLIGRAHVITLQRATLEELEGIEKFNTEKHKAKLVDLGRQLSRWVIDNSENLASHTPGLPEGVINRRADKWRAMLSIAELAGGKWPHYAVNAIRADTTQAKPTMGLELLIDVHDVIRPGESKLWTEEVIDRICGLENSRWADHNVKARDEIKRKIRPNQIKEILELYNIAPRQTKKNGMNKNGYEVQPILEAYRRYATDPASVSAGNPTRHVEEI